MMAPSSPLSSAVIEEAPLISPRFLARVTVVVAALAALTLAISVAGRWFGQHILLAGHTTSTKIVELTIGEDRLRLPENTIRFESQRRDGEAERVDLYLTWPQMQGYTAADRHRFDDISQSTGLIFVQITQGTMSRDMSGRLEPIYSHLVEGEPTNIDAGLTLRRLREDAGYTDEVLLTAPRLNEPDYAVRCMLPSAPDKATSGDCQRDIKVGKDLSVLYRFSSVQLGDWDHIDAAIRTFVEKRLVQGQPGS
ncbi:MULTISPECIES: hypothetical protein [unclassified Sinorhizobium]|uniref:hypothetical protein n=1 Tax=unclassified Sinorhizobium TaxID=2613772 RepID=UPI0035235FEE